MSYEEFTQTINPIRYQLLFMKILNVSLKKEIVAEITQKHHLKKYTNIFHVVIQHLQYGNSRV